MGHRGLSESTSVGVLSSIAGQRAYLMVCHGMLSDRQMSPYGVSLSTGLSHVGWIGET